MKIFGEILQAFAEKSPVTVMVHGLLQRVVNEEKINHWFDAIRDVQYTKNILFSSLYPSRLRFRY